MTNGASNTVSVIDTATNTVAATIAMEFLAPFGVAITPNGAFAYVTVSNSLFVKVIETATNTVTADIMGLQAQSPDFLR